MASSRVSPSPKRCQAKAGGGRGKGCRPGGLCILLQLFAGVVVGKAHERRADGVQPQLATRAYSKQLCFSPDSMFSSKYWLLL